MAFFDFIKKKGTPDRYAGKPFLKIVDCFVLDCIGELDQSQAALLEQMLPKLRATYGHGGTWQEIVISQLQFDPDIRTTTNELWVKNQNIAKQNGVVLEPMQFVQMFVDANVTHT